MEELVIEAKNGNELSFKQLIELLDTDLYRIGRARLNNEEDIKDAIQNTMIYTYTNLNKLRENKYFKTWVIRIYINECNKIYKQILRNNSNVTLLNDNIEFTKHLLNESDTAPKISIYDLVNRLKYNDRIIILLHYQSGFSTSQIANILKINKNTAKSRLTRAIKKLQKLYKGENYYEYF